MYIDDYLPTIPLYFLAQFYKFIVLLGPTTVIRPLDPGQVLDWISSSKRPVDFKSEKLCF